MNTWDEAKHPRDKVGRWARRGGEADQHEAALRAGMNPRRETSVLLREDGTVDKGQGGEQTGPGGLQEWTSVFDVPEAAYRGAILLHTHPDDQPLSDNDVRLAITKGMAEIRAIGPTKTYILRPGDHHSILDAERFFAERRKLDGWAEAELWRRGGRPPIPRQIVTEVLDQREVRAAQAAGLDYVIRPVRAGGPR